MFKNSELIFNTVGCLLPERFVPISASQRCFMEQIFAKNAYPKIFTIKKIADELGLGEEKCTIGFVGKG